MSVENWKLWLVPFGAWLIVMSWYSGYQSGYQEGHETAWKMSRPNFMIADEELLLIHAASELEDQRLVRR